jgi:hypothetical protein
VIVIDAGAVDQLNRMILGLSVGVLAARLTSRYGIDQWVMNTVSRLMVRCRRGPETSTVLSPDQEAREAQTVKRLDAGLEAVAKFYRGHGLTAEQAVACAKAMAHYHQKGGCRWGSEAAGERQNPGTSGA